MVSLFPGATVVPEIALGAAACCSELHVGSHTSITGLLGWGFHTSLLDVDDALPGQCTQLV